MPDAVSSPLCTLLPVESVGWTISSHFTDEETEAQREQGSSKPHDQWLAELDIIPSQQSPPLAELDIIPSQQSPPFHFASLWLDQWVCGCVCVSVCVCDGVITARRFLGSPLPLQVKRMLCSMFTEHGVCEDSEWIHSGKNTNNTLTHKGACSSYLSTKALS